MLVGRSPFCVDAKDLKALHKNITEVKYTFPPELTISPEAKDLVKNLLQKNEQHRIDVNKIASHPFFHMNSIPKNLPFTFLTHPPSE
jgi:serine/threonine protein kinase